MTSTPWWIKDSTRISDPQASFPAVVAAVVMCQETGFARCQGCSSKIRQRNRQKQSRRFVLPHLPFPTDRRVGGNVHSLSFPQVAEHFTILPAVPADNR